MASVNLVAIAEYQTCVVCNYEVSCSMELCSAVPRGVGGPSRECCIATRADKADKGGGQCGRDQSAAAPLVELWAAYRAAVTRRDEWVRAYLTLCLYEPAPSGRGSDWHLELIPIQSRLGQSIGITQAGGARTGDHTCFR